MDTPRSLKSVAIDPSTVINTAFHLFKSNGEISLIFEGPTDWRFWRRFVDPNLCRVEILGDEERVIAASQLIDRLTKRFPEYGASGPFALAVADLDYDFVQNRLRKSDSLRYIQLCKLKGNSRDIEVVMIQSQALHDYLLQEDMEHNTEQIRAKLLEGGAKIGSLRCLASEPSRYKSPFGNMKDLPWEVFYEPEALEVDLEKLATALCRGERLQEHEILQIIRDASRILKNFRPEELARGHDLMEMLARHLAEVKARRFYSVEVEKDIRLAFGLAYALHEPIYQEIRKWGLAHSREILCKEVDSRKA